MAEPDGVGDLRGRLERRTRTVPPPRVATNGHEPATNGHEGPPSANSGQRGSDIPTRTFSPDVTPKPPRRRRPPAGPVVPPNDPVANLAVRVRRTLDQRAGELVHQMRRDGVRTSKVELLELLLWELPDTATPELRARLAAFRQQAPRDTLV